MGGGALTCAGSSLDSNDSQYPLPYPVAIRHGEAPLECDALLHQSGNVFSGFPRRFRLESQIQHADAGSKTTTEHKLSVISIEGNNTRSILN